MSLSGFRSSCCDQLLALERVPRRAELHLQQPLLAGDGVEEPAVRLLRPRGSRPRCASFQSVSLNRSDSLDAVDHVGQDAAVPAAGLAGAADAVARVPAAAVGLPGHPGVAAHLGDVQVALALRPARRRSRTACARRTARRPAPGRAPRRCRNGSGECASGESADCGSSASCVSAFRLSALRSRVRDNVLRRAGGHDVAALVARLGPQVDHPVGRLDHVEVVLDHHHRVAQVDQPVEHVEQLGQVVEVQAGGRLVEQVERPAGVGPRELGGQLHALRLAAGERRRRLAEREVVEPHVAERLQDAADLGDVLEQLDRLAARHVEHVGDRLAVVADGQRLGVVAPAAARVALDPDVGQEVHLDPQLPVAFALLAPPARHVEAEPPRRVAAELGLGQLGEERADQVEHAGVRGRVRGRRLPQRLLIDADHLVDLLDAADRVVRARERSWRGAASGPAAL